MIGCEGVRELAQDYLDGSLAPLERERLEHHLHACPPCRQMLAEYRRLFAALAEPAMPEPRAGFAARTMARVAAAERRRHAWQAAAIAAALFAAAAAATLLTWGGIPQEAFGLGEAASLDAWNSAVNSVVSLVTGIASASGEWLAGLPGGPLAVVLLVIAAATEVLLAYRWRGLASLHSSSRQE